MVCPGLLEQALTGLRLRLWPCHAVCAGDGFRISECLPTHIPSYFAPCLRSQITPYHNHRKEIVPSQELSALTNSKRAGLKTTTTSSHPFTRLEELSDVDRQWASTIPVSSNNYTTIAEQGIPRGEDHGLSTDKLQIRTDPEQSYL